MIIPSSADGPREGPPRNVEAEEALLGSILINPGSYWEAADVVMPEDFYLVKHGWVWAACGAVLDRREPLDFLTVTTELENQQRLDGVGGPVYISRLMDAVPSALNAATYAGQVEGAATRRRMLGAASRIAQLAGDTKRPIDDVIADAERALFDVSEKRPGGDLQPVVGLARAYQERVAALGEGGQDILGPPTGFADLDILLGGLGVENYTLVAGRPGMGKTGFLLNLVGKLCKKGDLPVAFFSLEMSSHRVINRLVAWRSGIDSRLTTRGKVDGTDAGKFSAAIGWVGDLPLYIDDTASLTPSQLRSRCRRLYAERGGLRLIVVDYLQLMGSTGRHENAVQRMGEISRSLKNLAQELHCPLIAAAQLSRRCEYRDDKRPVLPDLRESGQQEQDADIVIFIYRHELHYYGEKPGEAELIVAKNRDGPTGKVFMQWHPMTTSFTSAGHRMG